jgi:hypothetical protein
MRNLLMSVLGVVIVSALNGCVVYSEPGHTSSSAVRRSPSTTTTRTTTTTTKSHGKSSACGPAHHWDGDSCVHNGKAKGHNK